MSTKTSRMVYLAGPIDDVTREEARRWRESAPGVAPGLVFFSPAHAYLGASRENFPAVDRMNRAAILTCDGLVANIAGEGRAFGTTREIEFAVASGKPVAVVGEVVSLMSYDLMLCGTLTEAFDRMLRTLNGVGRVTLGG